MMTACLSIYSIERLLIWLVTLVVIVAVLKLVVPYVMAMLGADGGIVVRIIGIVVWGIVAIALIIFVFSLLGCLPYR